MTDKKPMNDVMDHMKNIDGSLPSNVDLRKLPNPLRYLGYFFIGFMSISLLIIIIGLLVQRG